MQPGLGYGAANATGEAMPWTRLSAAPPFLKREREVPSFFLSLRHLAFILLPSFVSVLICFFTEPVIFLTRLLSHFLICLSEILAFPFSLAPLASFNLCLLSCCCRWPHLASPIASFSWASLKERESKTMKENDKRQLPFLLPSSLLRRHHF